MIVIKKHTKAKTFCLVAIFILNVTISIYLDEVQTMTIMIWCDFLLKMGTGSMFVLIFILFLDDDI